MKKWMKGFVSGIIVSSLTLSGIAVYATGGIYNTIDVVINSVNLVLDGQKLSSAGESYILDNGDVVPYTILYNGTTYLPVKKISEIFDKDIGWNGDTRTVSLGDQPETQDEKLNIVEVIEGDEVDTNLLKDKKIEVVKFGNDFYKFEYSDWNASISSNNLYIELDDHRIVKELHSVVGGNFVLGSSDNPNLEGDILYIEPDDIPMDSMNIQIPYYQIDASGKVIEYGENTFVYDGVKTFEYNMIKYIGKNDKTLVLTHDFSDITIDNYNVVTIINGREFIDFRKWCDYLDYKFKIYFDDNVNVYIIEIFEEPVLNLADLTAVGEAWGDEELNILRLIRFNFNEDKSYEIFDRKNNDKLILSSFSYQIQNTTYLANSDIEKINKYIDENH